MSVSRTSIYIHEFYSGMVVLMSYILGLYMLNLKQRPLLCLVGIPILRFWSAHLLGSLFFRGLQE